MLSPHGLLIRSHRDHGRGKLLAHAVEGVLEAGLPDGLQALLAAADASALVLVVAEAGVGLAGLHGVRQCQPSHGGWLLLERLRKVDLKARKPGASHGDHTLLGGRVCFMEKGVQLDVMKCRTPSCFMCGRGRERGGGI